MAIEKAEQEQKAESLTGSGYLKVIRENRHFRQIWLAQVVSLLGDWFSLVAVVTIVTRYTGSAEALAGLFIVRLAPMFILGPFSGVLADRFNRRNLMIVADIGRAGMALGFLLIGSASDLWLIYVLTLVQFSLGSLFEPSRSALVPALTRPDERVAANSLSSLTWSTMLAIGSALGGLTAGFLGTETAFVVDSLSFVGAALLVSRIPAKLAQSCNGKCDKIQMGADLKAGFGYLKERPALFAFTLIKPLAALSGGALFAIMGLQARNAYPLGQDGSLSLGLLNLMIGVGSGLGPWLAGRLLLRMGENRRNMQKLIGFSFILFGLGYAVFCNTGFLLVAMLMIFIGELGGGSMWVFSSTLLQLDVEEKFRGRVFAVELALMNLSNVVAALVGGLLLDQLHISVEVAGIGLGLVQVTIGLVWLVVAARVNRNLKFRQELTTTSSLSAGD